MKWVDETDPMDGMVRSGCAHYVSRSTGHTVRRMGWFVMDTGYGHRCSGHAGLRQPVKEL